MGEYYSGSPFKVKIDENTKIYTSPFNDRELANIDIPTGIYNSYYGFDLLDEETISTEQPNYKWHKLNYNGNTLWVKKKVGQRAEADYSKC